MTNLLWALVCFSWLPNNEPDLAGYRLYCGGQPGIYTNAIQILRTRTSACVSVQRGVTNYFALTAVNAAGTESLPTVELAFYRPEPVVVLVLEGSQNLGEWTAVRELEFPLQVNGENQFYRGRVEFR